MQTAGPTECPNLDQFCMGEWGESSSLLLLRCFRLGSGMTKLMANSTNIHDGLSLIWFRWLPSLYVCSWRDEILIVSFFVEERLNNIQGGADANLQDILL